jgi:amino acid adenylation domain-containing protein
MTGTEPATLLGLLADGARRHPRRCAVRDQAGDISYRDMLTSVLELAGQLRRAGVRGGDPGDQPDAGDGLKVVVNLPPGREAIAGCIAAASVGVYVPLDSAHPVERRQAVLEAMRPCVLLADGAGDLRCELAVDVGSPRAPGRRRRSPVPAVVDLSPGPNALAYVIHTSGSTGVPKGVMLRQAGLSNVIAEQRRLLGLPAGSRVLQASSMAYDASVFEIALALGSGSTLVVPGRSAAQTQAATRTVDCAVLTPSLIRQLNERDTAGLSLLVSAGEALSWPDLSGLSPQVRVVNAYGPTETTIWATLADLGVVGRSGRHRGGAPSIGRPIRGLDAAVRTRHGLSCYGPARGELLISGIGLAAGYYRRPAETRDSFLFLHGRRWYRTRDVVRRDRTGALHYLHRLDTQVKVAGHRIELGEIEACARDVADVAAAAAIAVPDPVQNNRIELFIVPRSPAGAAAGGATAPRTAELPDAAGLVAVVRRRTQERLPAAMRPSRIRLIGALPLTTSGKVDHAALAHVAHAPGGAPPSAGRGAGPPPAAAARSSSLADLITALVAEILDVPPEEVDAGEDLVVLGGSSLTALELANRLTQQLGQKIEVDFVLGSSSLSELASRVERLVQEGVC